MKTLYNIGAEIFSAHGVWSGKISWKNFQAGGSQLYVVRVEREMSRWRGYLHLHSMVTPGTYEEQSLSHQPARPGHFWNPSEDILCANTASLRFHVWGTGLEVRMTLKVSPSRGKFTTVFFWGRCTDLLSLHFFIRWLWAGHWVPLTISQSICLWSICCQHFALAMASLPHLHELYHDFLYIDDF